MADRRRAPSWGERSNGTKFQSGASRALCSSLNAAQDSSAFIRVHSEDRAWRWSPWRRRTMSGTSWRALTSSPRRLVTLLSVLAIIVFFYFSSAPTAPGKITYATDNVVVFESAIHDEVNGAIGKSLAVAGIYPLFLCSFRYKFEEVLSRVLAPVIPQIHSPYVKKDTIEERLDADEIDTLILTTCSNALPRLLPKILAGHAKVVCVIHHSGPSAYHGEKKHLAHLIKDHRIAVLVLGEHVRRSLQAEVLQWAENEEEKAWLDMPVLTLVPTFDSPGPIPRYNPQIWPSRVVIQGNIESGRRRYPKILDDLKERMLADPALWGYTKNPGDVALARINTTVASPFSLHLVGQRNKEHPVEIPPELVNVVEFHENLLYPDFYELLANMDLMVPAFAVHTTYSETASSSMAASVIARIPVLVTERHLSSYTYIHEPGYVQHSVAVPEVHAIEALRRTYPKGRPRASDREWTNYQKRLDDENAETWRAIWQFFWGDKV